jgi:hypothetical protein
VKNVVKYITKNSEEHIDNSAEQSEERSESSANRGEELSEFLGRISSVMPVRQNEKRNAEDC